MARLSILSESVVDEGIYSGGSWAAGLPLSNLATQQPSQVARSTDALEASTRFVVDIASVRQISSFALVNHNLSAEAVVRFRISNAADGSAPALDVPIAVSPNRVVFGSLPWGAFPWNGVVINPQPGGATVFYIAGAPVFGRYVLVDIADEGNAAGYVQMGRLLAGVPFVPNINMSWGAALAVIDDSRESRSVGGQKYFDRKPKRRALTCQLSFMTEAEAMGAIYDMQVGRGISGGMLAIWDTDDNEQVRPRRTIYGTLTELSPIACDTQAVSHPYTTNLKIEELI